MDNGGAIAGERSDANIRQPLPTRARQPMRAASTRGPRQVFGLMGFGVSPTYLALLPRL
jgi:hypothetical protein